MNGFPSIQIGIKKPLRAHQPLGPQAGLRAAAGWATVGGGSGRDWKSAFNNWVGRHEVKDHKQTEAYIALALEAAEFVVFIASAIGTGGASTFLALSAASVAVPGVKAALSTDKYDTLAAANQGQVRGDLAIVIRRTSTWPRWRPSKTR